MIIVDHTVASRVDFVEDDTIVRKKEVELLSSVGHHKVIIDNHEVIIFRV